MKIDNGMTALLGTFLVAAGAGWGAGSDHLTRKRVAESCYRNRYAGGEANRCVQS